ncbi:hypothetical protein GE061_014077 [Apolygus lucorum]|uniref:Uncharacterized protein n=1 Tax=Apolygus lucorum TaxID=248454 RepID=A0A6A4JQY8_APOLU|nr:hypothetical protein GE061_014077 [Apolygus lucorum]
MSSSETPFSTADSEVDSTPTEVGAEGDGDHVQIGQSNRTPSGIEDYLARSRKNWERIAEKFHVAPETVESSSTLSSEESEPPEEPPESKKKVQLYVMPEGVQKVPEEAPQDEEEEAGDENLIYKIENGLISFEEAIKIQSEETAKEMDLRPGCKVLSFIPPSCLGLVRWIYEAKAFIPVKLDLSFFDVQELSVLQCFPYTRVLNLTGNKLRVDNMTFLQYLPNLKVLNVSHNRLYTCDLPSLKLKWVSFKKNRIVWMDPFSYPDLEYLNLDENRLKFVHFLDDEFCPNLQRVSFCRNRMRTTLAQWACSIRYVFLNYCKIRKIEGMENLVNMEVFHLRGCRVKKLHGFTWHMQSLSYLNLR